MATDTDPQRDDSTREPLDRDRILRAAIAMADEHGVAGLSMRKLAGRLGFEVMSLYNHVRNKGDLLEGMVEEIAREIEVPGDTTEWRAAVRQIAVASHDALLQHPWAAELWPMSWPGPSRWRLMERLLEALAGAGLPDDVADLGFHAVTLHITGFTQQQIAYRAQADELDQMMARFQSDVDPARYPHIHDHVRYHELRDAGRDEPLDEFGFVLDLILDGLEQARTDTTSDADVTDERGAAAG